MSNNTFNVDHFKNRDAEIKFIFEQVIASLQEKKPVNPQFIEFNGAWGIGKTTILRRIEDYCQKANLHPIWIDASDTRDHMFREVAESTARQYKVTYKHDGDEIDELLAATDALLELHEATVVFIDSLDDVAEERFANIEDILHRWRDHGKLLFVLASRSNIKFKNSGFIGWKLRRMPLKPFSREHCISYINTTAPEMTNEEISQLCLLTCGYPAALDIAVKAIKQEKLNLTLEQDRQRLMQSISSQVIEHGILAGIREDPANLLMYQTLLNLLAIPRYFKLPLMKKLVVKFADTYKINSGYVYMILFGSLNQNTQLFTWPDDKPGYSMAVPVRQFFLVKSKIEQPERHTQIHEFLMEQNWDLALAVSRIDRLHYIHEYLYHSASCLDAQKLQDNINKAMQLILAETPVLIKQFHEEYRKDLEMQEVFGVHINSVLTKLHEHLAQVHLKLAATAQDRRERVIYLQAYVFYSFKDPAVANPVSSILQCVAHIKDEFTDVCRELIQQLAQDTEIQALIASDAQGRKLE